MRTYLRLPVLWEGVPSIRVAGNAVERWDLRHRRRADALKLFMCRSPYSASPIDLHDISAM